MKCLALPLTVLLAGLVSARAEASSITTSASQPTGNIEISQLVIDPGEDNDPHEQIRKTAAAAWRELGQTFTVTSSFVLDKISVQFNQPDGGLTSGMSLYVDVDSVANVSAPTNAELIATGIAGFPDTGVTAAFDVDTDLWMTFDVTNVLLTPGGYAFRIGFDTPDFQLPAYQLGFSSTAEGGLKVSRDIDGYAGGRQYRRSGNTGAISFQAEDLVFVIQSDTVVPEPSAIALAGMSLLAAVGFRLRRRSG
jgi:hypothetical protein